MNNFIIYKHTCKISGKSYIGQSIQGLEKRWKQHLHDANKYRFPNNVFHRAIRKYGTECWEHEILYVSLLKKKIDASKHLKIIEKQFIKLFDTYKNENHPLFAKGDHYILINTINNEKFYCYALYNWCKNYSKKDYGNKLSPSYLREIALSKNNNRSHKGWKSKLVYNKLSKDICLNNDNEKKGIFYLSEDFNNVL